MKKKLLSSSLVAVLCLASVFVMTSCGESVPYGDYDLSDYVTVGEYKGLEYEKISVSVSDKEIDDEIQKRLEDHKTSEDVTEGTVKDGDTVNIDFTGTMDGKKFDGGSATGQSLTIGSGGMIPGFESGLIGKKVGDTVTLDLTFPDPYENNPDIAGKDATFEVKINSKKVDHVPEYDMDFVKEYYSDYKSLEEFEKGVKADLTKSKTTEAENQMKSGLWQQIVEASEVKQYPEEKAARIEKEKENLKKVASDYNMEWEDYLETIGYEEEDLNKTIETYAEAIVKEEMVLYSIAKTEGLEVSDDEYDEYLQNILKTANMDEDSFKSAYNMTIEEWGEENNVRASVLLEKVLDKVIEYGKEVSKK
ncbi:MAG: trigger factor [Emergencia sp.]|nr:trigger factor [Emergencia sp.]